MKANRQLQKGLEDYLACEKLLHDFFSNADYCFPECISQKVGKYRERMEMPGDPTQFPGNIGCCPYNFFKFSNNEGLGENILLEEKRLEKYGLPRENNSACGYHTSNGCILKDTKSPICLSFVCPDFSQYVHNKYGIQYNSLELEKSLHQILMGMQSPEEIQKFQDKVKGFILAIKKKVKN